MNIEIIPEGNYKNEHKEAHSIIIELDNGNRVLIFETDSGVLEVKNLTQPPVNGEMGLIITPQNYSTVHIIPEG